MVKTTKRKSIKNWYEGKKKNLRTPLLSDFYRQYKIAVKENDESYFKAFEDFLNANRMYENDFIPEGVFRFTQHCGENFLKRIYNPFCKKVIQINVFDELLLKEYILPKNMDDTDIQNNMVSSPMEIVKFWALWYLLVVDFKCGKKILKYELQKDKTYLLHTLLPSGETFTVRLVFKEGSWKYFGRDFDCPGGHWSQGDIFLYLSTVSSAKKL